MTARAPRWSWARRPTASRDVLVVLLAAVSGYVDAISYLGLKQVFTANMTGNTVLLGLAIGEGNLGAALRTGTALLGYIIGVAIAATIVHEHEQGVVWPSEVTKTLALEFAVLLTLAIGGFWLGFSLGEELLYILIVLSAFAMGLQSVAVRPLSVPGITTTYITGTWTSLIYEVAVRLHLIRGGSQHAAGARRPGGAGLQAIVLVMYGIAAVAGGAANAQWGVPSIFVAAFVVAVVAVLALVLFPRPDAPDALHDAGLSP